MRRPEPPAREAPAAEVTLPVGAVVGGDYEILAPIGRGSFGAVFKARRLSSGRLAAVKVAHFPDDADPETVEERRRRFRSEIRLSAALWHPNIVPVLDGGETAEGWLYAAFDFVPGETLRTVLATEGPLAIDDAVHLMLQILDALACAHAQGVVHRDLKPENVMVTRTGVRRNAMLLDFGLGGLVARREDAGLVGTLSYAAPEQIQGEPPSTRSDLYSWGLMLLECLTGESPVRGRSAYEILQAQIGSEPFAVPTWLRRHPVGQAIALATIKRPEARDVSIERLVRMLLTGSSGESTEAPFPPAEGERRQVSIVCCRIVVTGSPGSPADVEEIDDARRRMHAALATRAVRAGGRPAALVGDRVYVVFGWPQAHEDDARRAARLGLALAADPPEGGPGSSARCAVAVHTGVVDVRSAGEDDARALDPIAGVTAEVSSRLAEHAAPGVALVSAPTQALLRGGVETEPAGEQTIEALGRPLAVFRLRGRREARAGTRKAAPGDELPLVGRDHELQRVLDAWTRAAAGSSNGVLLVGEAGIGKSRLVRELRRRVPSESWFEWRCAPEDQHSALRPAIDAFLSGERSLESFIVRARLDPIVVGPLLGSLLDPTPTDTPLVGLSPERRKQLALEALADLVFGLASEAPMILVVENLHWSDPTTLDVVQSLVERVDTRRDPHARLLLVLTSRPETTVPWRSERVALLPVRRLAATDAETMVRASADRAAPPAALVEQIVRQAEGVPLFVEELARVVRESAARGGPGDGIAADLDIPTTLRDLLTARLDGVSRAARATAQLAAVLGREFSEDVLKAVSEKDAVAVRADILELEDAYLVFRRRVGRGYHFRHALLRDAAYDTLTRVHRQKLHARVADVLQERFAEVAEGRPEILALHLERGGRIGSSIDYWIRASDASFRRAAYLEVGSQADHALALVRGLPPVAENHLRAVDLLVLLGITRMSTMGWALPETEEPFVEAWEICEQLGVDAPPLALWGIWGVETTRSDRSRVEALLPRFRGFATRSDVPLLAHVGHSCLGISAFWHGDFRDADAHLGEALRLYREDDQRALAYDSGLYAHVVGATTLCLIGAARRAWQLCLVARTIAERRGDPYSLAVVLGWGSVVAHDRGDLATARLWAERLMALADEQRLAAWWAPAACALGRVLVTEGRTGDGLDLIRAGLDRYQRLGVRCSYNYYQTYLADAALRTGHDAEAAAAIDEGLALCRDLFARFHEPELWRLRGGLHRRLGRPDAAEADLRGALAQAEDRGALVYALRASLDLADLWIDAGRTADAVALVQPIHDRFDEHEGADVERAAVLLRALA